MRPNHGERRNVDVRGTDGPFAFGWHKEGRATCLWSACYARICAILGLPFRLSHHRDQNSSGGGVGSRVTAIAATPRGESRGHDRCDYAEGMKGRRFNVAAFRLS